MGNDIIENLYHLDNAFLFFNLIVATIEKGPMIKTKRYRAKIKKISKLATKAYERAISPSTAKQAKILISLINNIRKPT
jgi:hypothetical protein